MTEKKTANTPQPKKRDLLKEYRTTAADALSPKETLGRLRASGLSAMIDEDNGLWINEMCMGQYDSQYAQNKIRELAPENTPGT